MFFKNLVSKTQILSGAVVTDFVKVKILSRNLVDAPGPEHIYRVIAKLKFWTLVFQHLITRRTNPNFGTTWRRTSPFSRRSRKRLSKRLDQIYPGIFPEDRSSNCKQLEFPWSLEDRGTAKKLQPSQQKKSSRNSSPMIETWIFLM